MSAIKRKWTLSAVGVVTVIVSVCAVAQEVKQNKSVQGEVRAAGLKYYLGMIFGDSNDYLKATRMPLCVVRDGVITNHDEKETRALLTGFAERNRKSNLTEEERTKLTAAMIAIFDDAGIEFVGANTASLTFIVKHGAKESDGDFLATIILHRAGQQWKVIEEITDSAAVPAAYLN